MNIRHVKVTNIPIRGFVTGYVAIPADTKDEDLDAAITRAIRENGWTDEPDLSSEIDPNIDLDKWCFDLAGRSRP